MDYKISIHVPRKGNDSLSIQKILHLYYFNPRSPQRERLIGSSGNSRKWEFQSTFPAKGTTEMKSGYGDQYSISIHVPRKGNDRDEKRIW